MATATKAKGGRPSTFNVPAVLALVAGVRRGLAFEAAARAAGVSRSVAFRWLQSARAGDPEFAGLVEALGQAERDRKAEQAAERATEVECLRLSMFGTRRQRRRARADRADGFGTGPLPKNGKESECAGADRPTTEAA